MVYVPRISFKTCVNATQLRHFPTNGKYTGTQKLLLARTRIFGQKLSDGSVRSGMSIWREVCKGRNLLIPYKLDPYSLHRDYSFCLNQYDRNLFRTVKQQKQQQKTKKQERIRQIKRRQAEAKESKSK